MDIFENDPSWKPSFGEKIWLKHYRNGHYHAEVDPNTGQYSIHYDKHDPYESLESLAKHVADSDLGKAAILVGGLAILGKFFK